MESDNHQKDDGFTHIQRLTPGKVDVVLGAHPGKRKVVQKSKSNSYAWILVALLLVGLAAFAVSLRAKTSIPPRPTYTAQPAPTVEEPVQGQIETPPAAETIALAKPYVAPVLRHEAAVSVQPLNECMKNGNVIDENVLNCRFGQVPRAAEREPAKGMVSANYMADFKSDTARPHSERPTKAITTVSVSFRAVDSRNRYHADFRMFNNHIDNSSVCMNFTKGTAEHRECRRAAVVFFKESCLDWTKRAAKDRDEQSQQTRERYCEANRTFEAG
jgi:hypothetical protein